jgi:hypothetical protein
VVSAIALVSTFAYLPAKNQASTRKTRIPNPTCHPPRPSPHKYSCRHTQPLTNVPPAHNNAALSCC